jgi:hypothetical protein
MIVTLRLTEAVYDRLAALAADDGCSSVAAYLGLVAARMASKAVPTADDVARLAGMGLTDRQIAAHTNQTNLAVASMRRAAGVPANRKYRR